MELNGLELHHLFYTLKQNFVLRNDLNAYVGKENSKFKTLEEVEATYCPRGGKWIKSLICRDDIEQYIHFLKSDFTPHTTIPQVFRVIYFDYPKLCNDLIIAWIKAEVEKSSKPTKDDSPILGNDYVSPDVSVENILRVCVKDEMLHFLATYLYRRKLAGLKEIKAKITDSKLDSDSSTSEKSNPNLVKRIDSAASESEEASSLPPEKDN